MNKTLSVVVEEAGRELGKVVKSPDVREALERLHELTEAAGLGGIKGHKLVAVRELDGVLQIETEWSVRGGVHSEEFYLPMSVVEADDPVRAAKLWGMKKKVTEARSQVMQDRRALEESERELAEATVALIEEFGEIEGAIPDDSVFGTPDWKGLISHLADMRRKSRANSEEGSQDERQAWEGNAALADEAIRMAMRIRDHVDDDRAGTVAVALIGSEWRLLWNGTEPLTDMVEKHGLRIGDRLYVGTALKKIVEEIRDVASDRPSVSEARTKSDLHGVALVQSANLGRIMRVCNEFLRSMR